MLNKQDSLLNLDDRLHVNNKERQADVAWSKINAVDKSDNLKKRRKRSYQEFHDENKLNG